MAPFILNLGTRWRWVVGLSSTSILCNTGLTNSNSFIRSIGMCRMRRSLAVLRSFFHSCLLHTLSFHPLPFRLTSSCHLFLGLTLSLVVYKLIHTFWGILFSSILCTCPNQSNPFNLNVSVTVGFLTFRDLKVSSEINNVYPSKTSLILSGRQVRNSYFPKTLHENKSFH